MPVLFCPQTLIQPCSSPLGQALVGRAGYTSTTINAQRTVVAELISGGLNNAQSAPIETFLESSGNMGTGTQFCTANQEMWARSVDDEEGSGDGDFVTTGGVLWILGYKSENKDVSSIVTTSGGMTEVLGGYVNCTGTADWPIPMISNSNSSLCYTGYTNMLWYFPNMIQEISGTDVNTELYTSFPLRDSRWPYQYNYFVPLYVGGPRPSGPLGQFEANGDIGAVAAAGSTINYNNNTYFIDGSGADIYGTADACQFVNASWSGTGSIIALVNSVDDTSDWAKAGVMFRSSTNANAMFVNLVETPGHGITMTARAAISGTAVTIATGGSFSAPYWVKLDRSATGTFVGSTSPSGAAGSWTQLGTATVSMPNTAIDGLCVTAHNNNGTLCRSIMSNVSRSSSP